MGAPLVPDILNGFGTAITFQLFGEGESLEGGTHEWTDVCGHCEMRVTLADGTFVIVDTDGGTRALEPGVYELREYRGLFLFSARAPHEFDVQLHGLAKIERLA